MNKRDSLSEIKTDSITIEDGIIVTGDYSYVIFETNINDSKISVFIAKAKLYIPGEEIVIRKDFAFKAELMEEKSLYQDIKTWGDLHPDVDMVIRSFVYENGAGLAIADVYQMPDEPKDLYKSIQDVLMIIRNYPELFDYNEIIKELKLIYSDINDTK